ncbi:MAG TPA: hypothetical protein VGC41_29275, partial [Kofleriaceae bacterium]
MKDIALEKYLDIAKSFGVTKLKGDEAQAIVALSRLAIDADRTVDGDELDMYDDLADIVCEMAGVDADEIVETEDRKPRGDDDRVSRLVDGVAKLGPVGVRELAYATAWMLTIADLAIQPDEDAYLSALQDALKLSDDRIA